MPQDERPPIRDRFAIYRTSTIIIDADDELTPHEQGYEDGYYGRDKHIQQKWGDQKRQEYENGYFDGGLQREMERYMASSDDTDEDN